MTASRAKWRALTCLLATFAVGQNAIANSNSKFAWGEFPGFLAQPTKNGLLAQVQTGQDPSKPLPNINLGPVPASKLPSVEQRELPPRVKPFQDRRRSMQLTVDPNTGRPLTPWELRQRKDPATDKPAADKPAADRQGPTLLLSPRINAKSAQETDKPAKDGDIRVKKLDLIGVDSIGLLTPKDQGFPADMWRGTSYRLLSRVLPALPVTTPSRTMRSLARRLLLSASMPPVGAGTKSGLLQLRLERTAAAGWHEQVLALLQQVPGGRHEAAFALLRMQALLALGRDDEACNLVRRQIERAEAVQWQMAMAYCFARNGESAKLELYETLLYEAGIDDPLFFELLSRLSGRGGEDIEEVGEITPLHAAMMAAAAGKVPEKLALALPGGLTARFSATENIDIGIRIAAAERAGALGLIAPDALAALYESPEFKDGELKNPVAALKQLPDPMAMALLYQAAIRSSDAGDGARYVAAAMGLARQRGLFNIAAAVFRPLVREFPAVPSLAWFAAEAGRVFLVDGDVPSARRWMIAAGAVARQGDGEAIGAILELTPLLYVVAGKVRMPVVQSALKGWWRAEVASGREDRFRRAAVFYTLLGAFGQQVPAELWENLLDGPDSVIREPSPGVQMQLRQAIAEGRLGATVLFSLLVYGDKGPGGVSTDLLAQVVEGLLRVGLRDDAQRLALETMIAEGF